jgi:hypothetical protein
MIQQPANMQLTQILPIIIVLGAVVMAFFTGKVIWQEGKKTCTKDTKVKQGKKTVTKKGKCTITGEKSGSMKWGMLGGALGMALCGMFVDTMVGGSQYQQYQQ